jgi:hypothetical protein
MQTYTSETYRLFINACLAKQTPRLMTELQAILQRGQDLPASRLDVVVSPEGVLKTIPISLHFIGGDGAPLPGGTFHLDHLPGLAAEPVNEETVYQFDENGVETLEVELQALTDWFAEGWQFVSTGFSLPAFISIQDDLEALDLASMNWGPNPNKGFNREGH